MDDKGKGSRVGWTIFGALFIAIGAYELSNGNLGWYAIVFGVGVIAYIAVTGET